MRHTPRDGKRTGREVIAWDVVPAEGVEPPT